MPSGGRKAHDEQRANPVLIDRETARSYGAEADAILALKGVPQLTEITGVFTDSFSEPGACTRDTARWITEEMRRREG